MSIPTLLLPTLSAGLRCGGGPARPPRGSGRGCRRPPCPRCGVHERCVWQPSVWRVERYGCVCVWWQGARGNLGGRGKAPGAHLRSMGAKERGAILPSRRGGGARPAAGLVLDAVITGRSGARKPCVVAARISRASASVMKRSGAIFGAGRCGAAAEKKACVRLNPEVKVVMAMAHFNIPRAMRSLVGCNVVCCGCCCVRWNEYD